MYCWGNNGRGALGTGDPLTIQPGLVLGGVASVTSGEDHTCVLNSGGSASCFGGGISGQLGQGSYQNELSPVAVSGGFTFVSLEAGDSHTCGLETLPGDIYCWGKGLWGRLGNGSFASTNAPVMVTGGHSFVEVAGGPNHNCGITGTGDVYCWGENGAGQLGNNNTTDSANPVLVLGGSTYATVTAGYAFTCTLTDTGLAHCWGWNDRGQLGNATNTASSVPVVVAGGTSFTQIEAGRDHVCALGTTGTTFCWGSGRSGQLGDGRFNNSNTPQAVPGGFSFTSLVGGDYYTCAIRSNAEAMCWGTNGSGQLGDGTFDRRGVPTTVSGGHSFHRSRRAERAHVWRDHRRLAVLLGEQRRGTARPRVHEPPRNAGDGDRWPGVHDTASLRMVGSRWFVRWPRNVRIYRIGTYVSHPEH